MLLTVSLCLSVCACESYPSYLICEARISCHDSMGSDSVLVLQGFETCVGLVTQQVCSALCGHVIAHLLRQTLFVVPPLLQNLLKGRMPHQA